MHSFGSHTLPLRKSFVIAVFGGINALASNTLYAQEEEATPPIIPSISPPTSTVVPAMGSSPYLRSAVIAGLVIRDFRSEEKKTEEPECTGTGVTVSEAGSFFTGEANVTPPAKKPLAVKRSQVTKVLNALGIDSPKILNPLKIRRRKITLTIPF